jgi:hypothetical protein
MPGDPTPKELGLAEFAAALIGETFEAVTVAQAEQTGRLDDAAAAAKLTVEEFAEQFISDADVDRELARLVPSRAKGRPHAIFVGSRFRGAPGRGAAMVASFLGRRRTAGAPRRASGAVTLRRVDVARIRRGVRLRLAGNRQAALREGLKQGMPRVTIDSGKITARLVMRVADLREAQTPAGRRRLLAPLRPLGAGLGGARVVVRPVEAEVGPADQDRIVGEVEIAFKTV